MGIEDQAGDARGQFSSQAPGAPVKMCGGDAPDPSYTVDAVPDQLEAATAGVYGYVPKPGTQFSKSPPWPDWTDPDAVAAARATRLLYHQGFAQEVQLVQTLTTQGVPVDTIARQLSEMRNTNRMAMYAKEDLPMLYERNLAEYGRQEGPSYEQLLDKYKTPEKVIAAGMRTNPAMDVLTGIATVVPRPKL